MSNCQIPASCCVNNLNAWGMFGGGGGGVGCIKVTTLMFLLINTLMHVIASRGDLILS